jgi:tetratricopeptide (TPR) repeat protein
VQEELGRNVLQMLPAKVSEAELQRVAQRHTRNLEAYEYFQRGQMVSTARERAGNEAGREMYKRAIELDPGFARAYASLAVTYVMEHRNRWGADAAAALQRAHELALTALQINRDVPETYMVLSLVDLHRRGHKEALHQAETAIRLYPSYADGYAMAGGINVYMGQPHQGLSQLRTAMRLNPDGSYIYFLIIGRAYYALGDMPQAKLNLGHALSRNPADLEARVYMAATQFASGDKAAAAWEADEIRTIQPGFSGRAWLTSHPLADAKVQRRVASALVAIGLP